ncbi:MAG: hypothetical protein ACE5QV_06895, partial [Fidelibacterota bacterium]
ALKISTSYEGAELVAGGRKLGRFQLNSRARIIQSRFIPPGRTAEVEYDRRWNLPQSSENSEYSGELSGIYNYSDVLYLKGEGGRFSDGKGFISDRTGVEWALTFKKLPALNFRREYIVSKNERNNDSGKWLREKLDVFYDIWKLKPVAGYEFERNRTGITDSTGFEFIERYGGINLLGMGPVSAGFLLKNREDKELVENYPVPRSLARTYNYNLNLKNWYSLNLQLNYILRSKKIYNLSGNPSENMRYDLLDLSGYYTPLKKALTIEYNYKSAREMTAKKERIFIDVGKSRGSYSYNQELNEYYPDPAGRYILYVRPTGKFIPTIDIRNGLKLDFNPGRLYGNNKGKKGILSIFSFSSYFKFARKKSSADYPADSWILQGAEVEKDLIFKDLSFHNNLYVKSKNGKTRLRLRYFLDKGFNNQYFGTTENSEKLTRSVHLSTLLSKNLSSEIDLMVQSLRRKFYPDFNRTRDIRSKRGKIGFSKRFKKNFEGGVSFLLYIDRDGSKDPETAVNAGGIGLRYAYFVGSRGKFDWVVDWVNVSVSPSDRSIPYEMADGRRKGDNINIKGNFSYNLNRYLNININYLGEFSSRNRPFQYGQAEIRAYF